MPPLPPAPNVMKFRIVGQTNGRPYVHVMHAQYTGSPPSAADCGLIATALRNAYNTNIGPVLNTLTSASLFEVTDLASSVGNVGTNNTAVTGTAGPPGTFPVSACAVISWKTALHFRGGHCRTYLPWRNSTDLASGNALITAYQTALATAASGFLTATTNITSGSTTWTLAMLSYYHNHALRNPPISFAVTSAAIHQRMDTQRRRLGKEF